MCVCVCVIMHLCVCMNVHQKWYRYSVSEYTRLLLLVLKKLVANILMNIATLVVL